MDFWTSRHNGFRLLDADTGAGGAKETDAGADTGEEKKQPQTLDELFKVNPTFQSEFDRRMAKGLETAKAKWQQETAEKVSEAERMAKMTAERMSERS